MPVYEYRCRDCGHEFEIQQSMSDDTLTVCPSCSGDLRKVFSPVGIAFKGSGFYKNDSGSRSGSSKGDGSKGDGSKSGSSGSSSDSGSTTSSSSSDSGSSSSTSSSKGDGSGSSAPATSGSTSS
ncbi:MAG TPA: zinc ribbon domain-containing protein [Microthrixaceae bacterium]|nr:zinc ribbon domain-containing protein [Microthrixaceae bacterium]